MDDDLQVLRTFAPLQTQPNFADNRVDKDLTKSDNFCQNSLMKFATVFTKKVKLFTDKYYFLNFRILLPYYKKPS